MTIIKTFYVIQHHKEEFYSSTNNFLEKKLSIPNVEGQKLYASLFYKVKVQRIPQTCIIYCHGFGSTRLQSVHILKVLKQYYALCCFDFSGSGKSQGNIITYGAKQKEDINSVIKFLKSQLKFKKFILWGRSMGATACLLYSLKYQKSQEIKDEGVIFQIVDSPFISFQKIAVQMGKKYASIPQFGTGIVLDMMRKNCESLGQYNPFSVNLQSKISDCNVPTLFIYSESDEIVSSKNSQQLCSKFQGFYQKIIIPQSHNIPRTSETLSEVIKKIQIQLKKYEINKKNGIAFKSLIFNKQNKSKSNKKGIQRSLRKQNSKISSFKNQFSAQSLQTVNNAKSSLNKYNYISQITPQQERMKYYGLEISQSKVTSPNAHGMLQLNSKRQTPDPHGNLNIYEGSLSNFYQASKNNEQFNILNSNIKNNEYKNSCNRPISYSSLPHQTNLNNYQSAFLNSPQQTPQTHKIENINQVNQINQNQSIGSNVNTLRINEKNNPNKNQQTKNQYYIESCQNYDNIYQMKKPEVILTNNNFKNIQKKVKNLRLTSPNNHIQKSENDNPLTALVREQINYKNKQFKPHRENQRKQSSTPKKLNISLLKFKQLKREEKSDKNIERQVECKTNRNCNVQYQKQTYLDSCFGRSKDLKASIRPYSSFVTSSKGFNQPLKSAYQTTTITKNTSLSSSMDNFHFLGVNKSIDKQRYDFERKNNLYQHKDQQINQINNRYSIQMNSLSNKRNMKTIRSSQIIYYDKNSYRYGI